MTYNYIETVPYLLDWFTSNARILAWRDNPTPYNVWISEIMLQQTRVEAVKGYFDRFVTALPDIKALAEAEEEVLLKLWEGLGYYNRVRNLQKAAVQVMNEYNGELPADYEVLLKLPGIGSYTAGAIASIAFGIPVPAVDGNVLRVMKRIAGSLDDITKENVKKQLMQDIQEIIPKDCPGEYNQALMELGAMICIPNGKPLCDKCPVMHLCKAFHEDKIAQIPVKPEKKQRRIEMRTILLLEYQDRYAIRKRPAKGLLAGMWELPALEQILTQEELILYLKEEDLAVCEMKSLGKAKHIFTHVEWHMVGYRVQLENLNLNWSDKHNLTWASLEEIVDKYSIANAFSAYMKEVKKSKT